MNIRWHLHKPGVRLEAVRDTVRRIQAKGLRAKGLFMMGLPGETRGSILKTTEFALSLDLDDMNMSKFTPFHGAPLWNSIREEGTLDEDWRKMNCLNFRILYPRASTRKKVLEQLYNQHCESGFIRIPPGENGFETDLWEHRQSLSYFLRHLPSFLSCQAEVLKPAKF
jgi:anaerobic magnesium-protoporphyrin IX monomethyl ester cyclase